MCRNSGYNKTDSINPIILSWPLKMAKSIVTGRSQMPKNHMSKQTSNSKYMYRCINNLKIV